MIRKAKQSSKSRAEGPELTDDELEGVVGGAAAIAPGANTLNATPLPPAGQSLQGMAPNPRDWRAVAEANGIENPRRLPAGALIKISPA
jgi:hypothetical protein